MSDDKRPIEIQKSGTEKIVIAIKEFEGEKYIDLRTYLKANPHGEWQASTRGVTVPLSKASELRIALDRFFSEYIFTEG